MIKPSFFHVKAGSKNGAARKIFGPSYFVTALAHSNQFKFQNIYYFLIRLHSKNGLGFTLDIAKKTVF